METYVINGVEIQHDTFDVEAIALWDQEVDRVAEESQRPRKDGETPAAQLRRICQAMLDLFDRVCGEGTARAVFGDRVNIKAIYEGYTAFSQQINENIQGFAQEASVLFDEPAAQGNRAQRRAEKQG